MASNLKIEKMKISVLAIVLEVEILSSSYSENLFITCKNNLFLRGQKFLDLRLILDRKTA